MRRLALALVLLLAVPALGDGPTSRPLTPAQQVKALKAEIEQLKAENEQLRLKLADLEGKIAGGRLVPAAGEAERPKPQVDEVAEAVTKGKVIVGETKDQARKVLDRNNWTTNIHRDEDLINGKRVRREVWNVNETPWESAILPHKITLENDVVIRVE